jgi:hypothetical protein
MLYGRASTSHFIFGSSSERRDSDLAAQMKQLQVDWRWATAYNAALQAATGAGYRATRTIITIA